MGATQICIACIVTLWINWAHFMSWASAGTMEMMAAAQGMAGREDRWGPPLHKHALLCVQMCTGAGVHATAPIGALLGYGSCSRDLQRKPCCGTLESAQ